MGMHKTVQETRPGRGGSLCKRIRRTAARFVVAWEVRRKRWPKGWELKTRKHGPSPRHGGMPRKPGALPQGYQHEPPRTVHGKPVPV